MRRLLISLILVSSANAAQNDVESLRSLSQEIKKDPTFGQRYAARGILLLKAKRYAEALNDCTTATQLQPTDPDGFHCRGSAYLALNKQQQARENLERAIALNPAHALAHLDLATLAASSGRLAEALAGFNRAIEFAPDLAPAYLQRAQLHEKSGRFQAAIDDYSRALSLEPVALAYQGRAALLGRTGQHARAAAEWTELLKISPNSPDFLMARGRCYQIVGETGRSRQDYLMAARLNPSLSTQITRYQSERITPAAPREQAPVAVVAAVAKPKPVERAAPAVVAPLVDKPADKIVLTERKAATAVAPEPERPRVEEPVVAPPPPIEDTLRRQLDEAGMLARANKPQEAIASYSAAIALKSDMPGTYVDRARLHRSLRDYAKSISDYDEAVRLKPGDPKVHAERCAVHSDSGDVPSALHDCAKSLDLGSKSVDTLLLYARLLARVGRLAEAAHAYESSLLQRPDDPESNLGLAQVYFDNSDLLRSLAASTRAIQQRPGYKEAFRLRAIVKLSLGDGLGHRSDMAQAEQQIQQTVIQR